MRLLRREQTAPFYRWLLAAMAFFIPLQIAPANVLLLVLLVLWSLDGGWREKWRQIRSQPLVWLSWAYVATMLFSLLWTDDWDWGVKQIGRLQYFFFLPVLLQVYRREWFRFCLVAWLTGCVFAAATTDMLWFKFIFIDGLSPALLLDDLRIISPWQNRIILSPILAFACFVVLVYGLQQRWAGWQQLAAAVGWMVMAMTIVVTAGRTGLLAFALLSLLAVLLAAPCRLLLRFVAVAVLAVLLPAAIWTMSDTVRERFDEVADVAAAPETHQDASSGRRYMFALNTLRMISEHPLSGVGLGDFPQEYARINALFSPDFVITTHPHNQYLLAQASAGVSASLALLALLLLPPWRWSRQTGEPVLCVGLAVFFALILLSEDYWWRPNTQLLYVILAIMLYPLPHTTPDAVRPLYRENGA